MNKRAETFAEEQTVLKVNASDAADPPHHSNACPGGQPEATPSDGGQLPDIQALAAALASAPAAWYASLASPAIDVVEHSLPNLPHVGFDKTDALRADYLAGWAQIWNAARPQENGQAPSVNASSSPGAGAPDRYFGDEAWRRSASDKLMVDLYQLNARTLSAMADATEGDPLVRARLRFLVDQWIAATSPANVLALNPQAQQALIDSQGETLRKGIDNLLRDLQLGRVTQSDPAGFEMGVDLASTPGAVVFETALFQVIQYSPTVKSVFERPLLIVPPCINKYYILDLRPRNSLVKHALDAGQQVFMVSWCNPDLTLASATWDDYVEGVLEAMKVSASIAQSEQINALGFCVGGALLSCAAAVDIARRGTSRLASLTLLTAMLDYSDTGVLNVFIDETHVAMRERTIGALAPAPGLMSASEFANTFSLLRPRDLFWNYVVDNYILGGTPPAFDLLFWNGDSTNLPGPMFSWYLRNMYLENNLREPGRLSVCDVPIDLRTLTMPTFIYGSRDDHIVPWRSAFASLGLLGGETCFVLGASGHIAGVINPPAANKRSYWKLNAQCDVKTAGASLQDPSRSSAAVKRAKSASSRSTAQALSAEAWESLATEHAGSWWPEWSEWLAGQSGRKTRAKRSLGGAEYRVIEAAPGRYVKQSSSLHKGAA